jgi:hypothetical protein
MMDACWWREMTKIFDDLEIFERDCSAEHIYGEATYAIIDDEQCSEDPCFILILHDKISEEYFIQVISHELEHYDVMSFMIRANIVTKSDMLNYVEKSPGSYGRKGLGSLELAQSNPSYDPRKGRNL